MLNKIIISLMLIMCLGCASYGSDVKFNATTQNFYKETTTNEQENNFNKYNTEEQYDIYIFGNQVVHPPATYLAYQFAKRGAVIVPFLKKKLTTTQNELTIRDIVKVFSWQSQLKLYDISKDQELMKLLDQRANDMRGIWKNTTVEMVNKIRLTH